MKCVTYNIQYATGRDGKVDLSRIIEEITGADIIALQEIDRHWPRTGNVDQLKMLRDHFSDYYCVFGAGVDLHLADSKPSDNKRRQFGNMILSRYPIEFSRHHLLPKLGSIVPLSIQRSAIEATIQVNNHLLRIYSVHLTHLSAETRILQLEHLLAIHQSALHQGHPVEGDLVGKDWGNGVANQYVAADALIFGDFNFQPDSREYNLMVGPISDYGGHITSHAGFVDAWCQSGQDKFLGATSDVKGALARLDYCFASAALRHHIENCTVDTTATGSDHFPVWLELSV